VTATRDPVHRATTAAGTLTGWSAASRSPRWPAHDPGAISRAQPAGVLNQFGIGVTEILPPDVSHVLRERLVIEPETVAGPAVAVRGVRVAVAAVVLGGYLMLAVRSGGAAS